MPIRGWGWMIRKFGWRRTVAYARLGFRRGWMNAEQSQNLLQDLESWSSYIQLKSSAAKAGSAGAQVGHQGPGSGTLSQ